MSRLSVRRAGPADADVIAAVFSPSIRLLAFLPPLHTVAEDRWFIENVILKECVVTVADLDGAIVSFLARDGGEIHLLHTHPDHIVTGIGSKLLEVAKTCGEDAKVKKVRSSRNRNLSR